VSEASASSQAVPSLPVRILFIEHTREDVELCIAGLRASGLAIEVDVAETPEQLRQRLRNGQYDLVLSDYRLPGWTGLDALAIMKSEGSSIPFLLITGTLGEEAAVECIKQGVADYVLKDHLARLPFSVKRALQDASLRRERERTQTALAESEESFRLLFASNPLPMWVYDTKTLEFLEVNEAATLAYGYCREEFLAMRITDVRPLEDVPRLLEAVRSPRPDLQHSGYWRHKRKDGRIMDVEVTSHRLPYGGREAALVISQDVTDHLIAERQLRLQSTALGAAANGIVITDVDGTILWVNPAFTRLTGYDALDAIGQKTSMLKSGKHPPAFYDDLWSTIRSGKVWHGELTNRRKDGTLYTEDMTITPLTDEAGTVTHFIGIKQDVTEQRTLERQVATLHKFDAIGRLAGGIAHDFNNVIGAIIGWADLAIEELPSDAPLRPRLEKIRTQADRAAALTRQLLAFARRQILEPRNVNLNQTVSETLGLLEKVIGRDVEIRTLLSSNLSTTRADPSQLEQVLMNLCLNSRDAMPEGGRLLIETQNVQFDEEYCRLHAYARPGAFVMLAVSDTGVGMDHDTVEHVFEPFFSTKETGKGTGLGLATVYGIVKQHNGFVNVYSEVGRGTTFRIYLPCAAGPADADAKPSTEQPRGGVETILVAEDHEGLHETVRETLERYGYTVLMASNGEEAVEQFRRHGERVSLLLLDVVMPRMSGPEAYQRISEMRQVPVIFATGYSSESSQLTAAAANGAMILQKPYTPSLLARRVREALDAALRG